MWAHYSLIIMCLNIGRHNYHHVTCGTNRKVVVLGVPILKHRVVTDEAAHNETYPFSEILHLCILLSAYLAL